MLIYVIRSMQVFRVEPQSLFMLDGPNCQIPDEPSSLGPREA
jgi:hypothetical protein